MIDISKVSDSNFDEFALNVFRFQFSSNPIYHEFCSRIGVSAEAVNQVQDIPFLPISFFKSHKIISDSVMPNFYFESSGTSGSAELSKHYIKDIEIYNTSIELGFRHFFGTEDYTIIGVLPHYLERPNSSLVHMVRHWMKLRGQEDMFYLYDLDKLNHQLLDLLSQNKKVILIGISFALLDLAERFPIQESDNLGLLTIIETGGMKGTRTELPKVELFRRLQISFPNAKIISEYGMCELLSQAFSDEKMLFSCPPWMKVAVSDINDPRSTHAHGSGLLQVIDLANYNSCSFIQTMDIARLYPKGSFELFGRMDHSDLRGCSLLYS
jgi:phenylacetate-coenzyme A ligase PaaK-like adenylate-forming protein